MIFSGETFQIVIILLLLFFSFDNFVNLERGYHTGHYSGKDLFFSPCCLISFLSHSEQFLGIGTFSFNVQQEVNKN